MKIAPRAIESFLSRPDAACRAMLLYGPDAGLARERARKLVASALAGGDDPFARVELPESALLADPARLSDELQSIGLLSSKRCVCIYDASDRLAGIIKSASGAFHPDVLLVVIAGELGPRSALRLWFESEPAVAALPCYHDEVRDIAALIRQTFAEARIQADADTVAYLSAQLGNDREVTRSELAKIVLYVGSQGALSLDEARALTGDQRDRQVDEIVTAAADKNLRALDAQLAAHARDGTSPVQILRGMNRYFLRLYFLRARLAAGYDLETTIANIKPKVFYKQAPDLARHARNWSLEGITAALGRLAEAELAVKTSDIPAAAASARKLFQLTQAR